MSRNATEPRRISACSTRWCTTGVFFPGFCSAEYSDTTGTGTITGVDVEAGITAAEIYYILMTGDTGPPTEGPLGFTSSSTDREAD